MWWLFWIGFVVVLWIYAKYQEKKDEDCSYTESDEKDL